MRYQIGEHLLDTDRFELTFAGEPVHLEPQVFLVLTHLIENRDRMVSKEELLDSVWETRFVTESALTSRIKSARRALGDDGRTQAMIRTVRGQGFRFVGDVIAVDGGREVAVTGPDEPPLADADVDGAPSSPSLPRFDNALRGREKELTEVSELLADHAVLTLVGPGGTGKTRLAVEVTGQWPVEMPTAFVDLAAVSEESAVPLQLAATLGIQIGQREAVLDACCEYLRAVPHLLVIDNCEHVIDAAAETVVAIMGESAGCRLLCTSREPLRVADEQVYRVGPLSTLPADASVTVDALLATASGSVFSDRARRGDHRFQLDDDNAAGVARLCRELDGLPLAIELAAGRLTALSLEDLLGRLDLRLDLLGSTRRSAEARHRSLRATIEWSYDQIGADAQRLLRYLAVHPAGVMLEAIERLGRDLGLGADPLDLVTTLVDSSLLHRHDSPCGARYVQLETLRAFGFDRLDHHAERSHADDLAAAWGLDLVARMDAELLSAAEERWAERVRLELPNLRAVRRHLVANDRFEDLVALSCHLHEWARLRDVSEVWSWVDELVEMTPAGHELEGRTFAIAVQGAWRRGRFDRAQPLAERALEIEALRPDPWARARARSDLAAAVMFAGDPEAARSNWLARVEIDSNPMDLANAGLAAAYAGDVEGARAHAAEARALAARTGSPSCIAWTAYGTGEVEHVACSGRHAPWLEQAIEIAATVGSGFTLGVAQVTLATGQAEAGDLAVAAATYRRLIEHWLKSGSWTQQWTTLRNAAALLEPHDPEVALAILVGAELDPHSPALADEAQARCEAMKDRLRGAVGEARAQEIVAAGATVAGLDLAEAARVALATLVESSEGGEAEAGTEA